MGLRGVADDDLFAVVREVGEVNRLIRAGLVAWRLVDAHEVFRERMAAVELGDSPAPPRARENLATLSP